VSATWIQTESLQKSHRSLQAPSGGFAPWSSCDLPVLVSQAPAFGHGLRTRRLDLQVGWARDWAGGLSEGLPTDPVGPGPHVGKGVTPEVESRGSLGLALQVERGDGEGENAMSNPSKEDIGSTIEHYRRRRERIGNYAIGALATILAVVGIVLIIAWLGGPIKVSLPFLTSPTPTATLTPTPSRTPTPSNTPTASPVPPTPTLSGPITYIVQQDDLLGSIAQKYGVTIAAIMAANPSLTDPSQIFVGQRLVIPAPGSEPSATPLPTGLRAGNTILYLVQPGDSLQTIAAKFNSTAEDIQKLNNITDPNKIYPGLYLKVRYGIATPTPTVVTRTPSPVPTASNTPTIGPTSTRAP